jgi:8-oxo-dGTP pyrophosphatase MutT (NUDIX family)/predicted ATPase
MLTDRDYENHDAVALIIKDNDGRFLCLFHKKFDFWTIPLGKTEDGQSPEQAAVSEALEEVGIEIIRLARRYLGTKVYCREGEKIVTFFHLFEALEYKGTPYNREPDKHTQLKFMTASELRDLRRTSDGTVMLLSLLTTMRTGEAPNKFTQSISSDTVIGLSGASGAGKTTFARRLRDKHGAKLHPESVRDWLAKKGNLRYAGLSDNLFAELQLDLLKEYETSDANVFDRSPLDCLYYILKVGHCIDIAEFRERAIRLLRRYSAIMFFPSHSLYLLEDGTRVADLKHQTEVASRMLVQAYEYGLEGKILIYDHCRTIDENVCELFSFLAKRATPGPLATP